MLGKRSTPSNKADARIAEQINGESAGTCHSHSHDLIESCKIINKIEDVDYLSDGTQSWRTEWPCHESDCAAVSNQRKD